jgi:hypothetical protein
MCIATDIVYAMEVLTGLWSRTDTSDDAKREARVYPSFGDLHHHAAHRIRRPILSWQEGHDHGNEGAFESLPVSKLEGPRSVGVDTME